MPDRELGRAATIQADLPGLDLEAVTVSVTNAVGQVVHPASAATAQGEGRYTLDLTSGELGIEGNYLAHWECVLPVVSVDQDFIVARRTSAGMEKHELRIQVGLRVDEVEIGTVSSATSNSIADEMLLGGTGSWRGWWIMLDMPSLDAGRVKRVRAFNGALELSSPWVNPPVRGDHYFLFKVSPFEIDRAVDSAISDIAPVTRLPVRVEQVPLSSDKIAPIPRVFTHVTQVWNGDTPLADSQWGMLMNRRLIITDPTVTLGTTLTLVGNRAHERLVWEDSTLDISPLPIVARAAQFLHAARARGAGVDTDEHLRRQMAAQDEAERALKRTAGRVDQGAISVIE